MSEEQAFIELVGLAQQGHENSLNQLAQKVKGRLYAYIYRVTLDYHLSQDLSQEALLSMVKSLGRLNKAERFWPWVYRIAQSKIQQHYRTKQRQAAYTASAVYKDFVSQRADYRQDDVLRALVQKELSKKIIVAMKELRQQYRAVLSLRCFDQLSYSDISLAMECNEVKARVLFYRAKQALKKQLARRGLSKSLLLMCLGVFGKLTAPAEAAWSSVTVTAASAKVGLPTAVIATATTKLGVGTVAAAVAVLATVGSVSILSEPPLPKRAEVKSFHYTVQSRNNSPGAVSSLSKGAYEQWYYFPDGVDGPMFMRMQRWDPQQKNELCCWLQNDQANYYYHGGEKQIYISNYRLWLSSLRVRRLPTDTVEFTSFLSEVEGDTKGVKYTRDRKTGLLVKAMDNRFVDARHFRTTYSYDTLDEGQFRYNWPAEVPEVDERDQMHKRGWTYFRISGEMDGQSISGRGRIPFVYGTAAEHSGWMTLNIGDELEIIDCSGGAHLRFVGKSLIAAYPSGTFFKGLARPWMGMHTIDIVRRDAARQKVWFETTQARNKKDILVTLTHEKDRIDTELTYTIDLENDIIKSIRFKVNSRTKGWLTFLYLQDIDAVDDEFIEPVVLDDPQVPMRRSPGMLWLVYLAEGNLGK